MDVTMIEYRVNGTRFIHVPTLIEKAKEAYSSGLVVESYDLVYTMFTELPDETIRGILDGTIETHTFKDKEKSTDDEPVMKNQILIFLRQDQQ